MQNPIWGNYDEEYPPLSAGKTQRHYQGQGKYMQGGTGYQKPSYAPASIWSYLMETWEGFLFVGEKKRRQSKNNTDLTTETFAVSRPSAGQITKNRVMRG